MKIYFDGILIDQNYYTRAKLNGVIFNDNEDFKLGTTICQSFTIGIDKEVVSSMPDKIEIEVNNIRYKQFKIDKIEENENEYIFYLVETMMNLEFMYDASEIFVDGKTTLKKIVKDICEKADIGLNEDTMLTTENNKFIITENGSMLNVGTLNIPDKEISWYNNTITAREYIGFVAELCGGYAIINNNNELEFRAYNNYVKANITTEYLDTFKLGDKHQIKQVIYDFGVNKYIAGEDGETLYISPKNTFITGQEDIDYIYSIIKDFEFYSIDNKNALIPDDIEVGDCITINTDYPIIVQKNNWNYNCGWIGGYKLNVISSINKTDLETKVAANENHIREVSADLDRANNQIVLKATEDGQIALVQLGTDPSQGSSFIVKAESIQLNGIVQAINNGETTTINGNRITTGSITSSQVAADIITTNNFSAQNINADNITAGTLSAASISLQGTTLTPTSSRIGGLNIESGTLSNNRMSLNTSQGVLNVFNNNGGSMILSNAARLSATAGIGISSNSNGNISAPAKNINIKACSDATVYIGSMSNAAGTSENSSVSVEYNKMELRSSGTIYANGQPIGGSSSLATKENIEDLTQDDKDELCDLIKNIPLKKFDYKKQYGEKGHYGFIIEDIEDTKLNDLLHIKQNQLNEDMKTYSSEDLNRLELVVIQELMNKIEVLENKVKELEEMK